MKCIALNDCITLFKIKLYFMLLYPFVHLFYVSILLNVKHPLIWMQNSFNVGLSAKLAHGQNCRKSELLNPRQPSSSLRNRKWILDGKYLTIESKQKLQSNQFLISLRLLQMALDRWCYSVMRKSFDNSYWWEC